MDVAANQLVVAAPPTARESACAFPACGAGPAGDEATRRALPRDESGRRVRRPASANGDARARMNSVFNIPKPPTASPTSMEQIGIGFIWFIVFLFSTTVHEAMHAWVAWRGGDPTAYHGGQVSLSPLPHIRREPIGMLLVPLLTAATLGW